jgi:hypothetical protein
MDNLIQTLNTSTLTVPLIVICGKLFYDPERNQVRRENVAVLHDHFDREVESSHLNMIGYIVARLDCYTPPKDIHATLTKCADVWENQNRHKIGGVTDMIAIILSNFCWDDRMDEKVQERLYTLTCRTFASLPTQGTFRSEECFEETLLRLMKILVATEPNYGDGKKFLTVINPERVLSSKRVDIYKNCLKRRFIA